MRKCFLLLMFASSTIAFAQTEFFFSGGLTKFNEKVNGEKFDHKITPSFKLGLAFWIPFSNLHYSINPGLTFGNHGAKYTDSSNEENVVTLGYVSIPVDFVYKFKPTDNSFFISAGAYFGYLVSAEDKYNELKINDGDYSYKNSDYGLNIGAGYILKSGWTMRLVYTNGLANILNYPSGSDDSYIKNTNIGLTIGWMPFNKKI